MNMKFIWNRSSLTFHLLQVPRLPKFCYWVLHIQNRHVVLALVVHIANGPAWTFLMIFDPLGKPNWLMLHVHFQMDVTKNHLNVISCISASVLKTERKTSFNIRTYQGHKFDYWTIRVYDDVVDRVIVQISTMCFFRDYKQIVHFLTTNLLVND
jgi:hypothetical protein